MFYAAVEADEGRDCYFLDIPPRHDAAPEKIAKDAEGVIRFGYHDFKFLSWWKLSRNKK